MKTRITELFGIRHPIIQRGMHYVGFAELAAALLRLLGSGMNGTANCNGFEVSTLGSSITPGVASTNSAGQLWTGSFHGASQSSRSRPGTRLNSTVLCETNVQPAASAMAAISRSYGPIGVPCVAR